VGWLFVLGAVLLFAVVLIVWAGRGIGFFGDQWGWIHGATRPSLNWVLGDDNGHLVATTNLTFWLLLRLFGIAGVAAFRAVAIGLHLLVVGALFVLVRRRLGVWPALGGALIIAVLGTGADAFVSALNVDILFATGASLGALIALDRGAPPEDAPHAEAQQGGTWRTDAAACILLVIALASWSSGVAFTAGVFVELLVVRGWRRLWVPLVPTVLYVGWRLHWAASSNGVSGAGSPLDVVAHGYQSATGAFAGLVGLQLDSPTLRADAPWLAALVAVVVGVLLLVLAATLARPRRVDPRLANVLVAGVVLWLLFGLFRGAHDGLYPSRYVYEGAVIGLLIIASAVPRGWFAGGRGKVLLVVGVAVSAALNVAWMVVWTNHLRGESATAAAQLAAVELSRATVPAGYRPSTAYGTGAITARDYLVSLDKFGPNGVSAARRLRTASESAREAADRVLVQAGSARLGWGASPVGGPTPRLERVVGGSVTAQGSCLLLKATLGLVTVDIASGAANTSLDAARGVGGFVLARRFGSRYVAVGAVTGARGPATLATTVGGDPGDPWHVRVIANGPIRICGP
jgi:hypothetical protein